MRGKGTKRDFWDYYADLWFDSGFLRSGRLRLGLFRSGKVCSANYNCNVKYNVNNLTYNFCSLKPLVKSFARRSLSVLVKHKFYGEVYESRAVS